MPKIKLCTADQREKNVSDALKCGMIRMGWTNLHLAKILGMDAGNLSRIIKHPMSCKFETLCIIANKLNITELPTK